MRPEPEKEENESLEPEKPRKRGRPGEEAIPRELKPAVLSIAFTAATFLLLFITSRLPMGQMAIVVYVYLPTAAATYVLPVQYSGTFLAIFDYITGIRQGWETFSWKRTLIYSAAVLLMLTWLLAIKNIFVLIIALFVFIMRLILRI